MPDTYAHFQTMTKLDDRTSESITRDEVERIAIGRTRVRPFDQERSRCGGPRPRQFRLWIELCPTHGGRVEGEEPQNAALVIPSALTPEQHSRWLAVLSAVLSTSVKLLMILPAVARA